jgi:hypothetical protein
VHFARHSQYYGEKELGREMLFNIAPNAHQKLKMRLVSLIDHELRGKTPTIPTKNNTSN